MTVLYHKDNFPRFAVAPMLDWTDRHCRFFHRLLSKEALLYSEMVVADAVIHGDRNRLLEFNRYEHPLALQLGGSDPEKLAQAARIASDFGYDEINLNVGCPSDRVQSGVFGACLMREPDTVARCVRAMKQAVSIPVTVKCRIGVDDQDSEKALDQLAEAVLKEGVDAFWVHARKAWLQGLSPKENRDIPPLDYSRVYRLKEKNSHIFIGINGGIQSLNEGLLHLGQVDGVMIGRAVYYNPLLLKDVDHLLFGAPQETVNYDDIIAAMIDYTARHIERGGRLSHVTRHMIGMFHGEKGARLWRQILSTEATAYDATTDILQKAYHNVRQHFATDQMN